MSDAPSLSLRPIRIGLLWHSARSGNLGVGALTLANLVLAREAAAAAGLAPRFLILGFRDAEARYVGEDEAAAFAIDTRSLLWPGGYWAALGRVDCLLDIGAGDSFADIYGAKRFAFLWLSKALAILRPRPLLLSPQTIGPFETAPARRLAAWALTRADAVVARDPMSNEALARLAPRARGLLSIDVAFALPYEDRSARRGSSPARIGINVSGLLWNEARSGRNRFGLDADYADLMERLIGQLSARPDVEVHLIAHVTGAGTGADDDAPVADALARAFPKAIRAPDFADPREAKSYISSLDFLVAGRMHACIAAFSAGVPVAPVAYSRKFAGLFGMLDYPWLIPVKGADTGQALARLLAWLDRREELARDVAAGMSRVEALLGIYRAELRRFLAAAAEGA